MLKLIKTADLSSGRASINFDGTIVIQQGRPFGVMANPGEVMLSVDDLDVIKGLLKEFIDDGHRILDRKEIRAQ